MDTPSKRVEMVPAKRQALILEHLRVNGAASIQELADTIGGSQSTVRRDLEHLMEKGYLERTHGGAHLLQPMRATFERETTVNAELQHAEKLAIGREAARRLSAGDSVIFDSSSTVMEAVRAVADRDLPLTVVTNSLEIADFAADIKSWRIILPGGTVRPGYRHLAGEPGESFIKTLHADLCMTGASAVTGTLLTETSLEVASLKRAMISSARKTILLVDSSKFTAPGFCTLSDISEIDEVITDEGVSQDALSSLYAAERKVTVVRVGSVAPRHTSNNVRPL
ncbi:MULTISPECIES: DeoR/GlpR family DNA-binding transcription regulator [unclassified Mesorhizobium]|uniref:DeoR/GlpR family DNA-binding transcription regulator n=1 Tax=unclassified Mesorhizobium TaxID=325217 RepID=UPI000F75B600|nr:MULTISPECIES: DeoR/GlpR family DNA-binding transcription regulator [unclassified Mesorhizobium]AZO05142.1 DeoR/GlpR transcriptional regulator [Mesorhizobium sp. M2A.F.Ca.ET.043.02.1.1]RWB42827.1 MAG: DeoR/GlpR transcriptional regulator [Mesorhizobium sp.]RWB64831.1 MAG: DeoR/GlpR transcriptional regulator [Mesorhizobium sp.]RWB88209.1 MAG: DeoR/GlpR transcriptional regulator [Mesorhizobium sp.]RWC16774.1 MAG: DeoR/GlpR transcriptional regulator [Mesorhizobium sp.]